MAGNFILTSITQSDLMVAIKFPHISWSISPAHKKDSPVNPNNPQGEKFAGWTSETRTVLSKALNNEDIGSREGLPPHRYLEIRSWAALTDKEQYYIKGSGWADNLVYPNSQGLGLKALKPKATFEWGRGNKTEALVEMLKVGDVSIEIYYQSGLEMY